MHFDVVLPVLYNPSDHVFYDGLGRELKKLGKSVAFLAHSRLGAETLRKTHDHVYWLYEHSRPANRVSVEEIRNCEQTYGIESMSDFVYPERQYWGRSYEQLASRTVFTFRWLEDFFAKHSSDWSFNNCGAEIPRRCARVLGQLGRGPRNILIDFAPMPGRVTLSLYEGKWDDLPDVPPPLTPETRAIAERIIAEATTKKKMFSTPAPLINPGTLGRYIEHFKVVLSGEHIDYTARHTFKDRLRYIARRPVTRFMYEQPVDGEEYLFFPLHVPGDSALTVMAPHCERQEDVIEYIANRALPAGLKLYVKPHPAGRDTYPLPMLQRIRSLPNVRLIEPTVNSHVLIQGSRGLVVINSTAGYEGLLYQKPVVALGRGWYLGHGVTRDVPNLVELRHALHEALDNPPDRESILRFVAATYNATVPAKYLDGSDENLQTLASHIVAKIERLSHMAPGAVRPTA